MIDKSTAEALGLTIDVATKDKHFGSFFGPGSSGNKPRSTFYYGRVQGPLQIQVGRDMYLRAEELKVVEHFEPLLIIGTDILTEKNTKTKFCYVGLHPEHSNDIEGQ